MNKHKQTMNQQLKNCKRKCGTQKQNEALQAKIKWLEEQFALANIKIWGFQ